VVEPCERENANTTQYFANCSQIADKVKINITDGTINKLGKALKKPYNFIRLIRKNGYVYSLNEFSYEE
jgi:hypothetical protein